MFTPSPGNFAGSGLYGAPVCTALSTDALACSLVDLTIKGFVISPFLILYNLAKDTFQDSCKLYVLFQRSNITMLVTKRNCGALFGGYYILESEIDSELAVIRTSLSEDEDDIQKTDIEKDLQDELSDIDAVDLSNDATDDELIEVLKDNEDDSNTQDVDDVNQDDLDDFDFVD